MAYPVAKSYSCEAGGRIVAGRFSYIPEVGMRSNVNKNTAWSVDPDAGAAHPGKWYSGYGNYNSVASMFGGWNAGIWCPGYSRDGALVAFGGGHGSNIGCFATIFDFTTRLWSTVGLQNIAGDGAWLTDGSRDSEWMDYSLGTSKVFELTHMYATVQYIGPQYSGVGSRGALYIPNAYDYIRGGAAAVKYAPHLLDLETGVMTRAVSSAPTNGIGDGQAISVLDTGNQKIWLFAGNFVRYIDLTQSHPRSLQTHSITYEPGPGNIFGTNIWVYEKSFEYCSTTQMILMVQGAGTTNGAISALLIDVSSGWPVVTDIALPTYTAAHGGQDISIVWVPRLGKFYLYEGGGDTFCTTLTPSSLNFRSCTWTWGKESFGGAAPASRSGVVVGAFASSVQAPWRHMHYSEPLECLVWVDGPDTSGVCVDGVTRTGLAQLWRPPGAPI